MVDKREFEEDSGVEVLVVLGSPDKIDDKLGLPLSNKERSGGFLLQVLDFLTVKWAVTYAVKCHPGVSPDKTGKEVKNKPSADQMRLCSEWLMEDVKKYKPSVIVCLGEMAMKVFMGGNCPKSLKAAGKGRLCREDMPSVSVLVSKSPGILDSGNVSDKAYQDLVEEYRRVFSLANKIAVEGWSEVPIDWELILDPKEALAKAKAITADEVFVDVETSQPYKGENQDARTIWHPDCKLICVSTTWKTVDDKYKTMVVAREAMTLEIMIALLGNRTMWAHNLLYEAAAFWRYFGINVFELATECLDSLLYNYLPDQNVQVNALKDLCVNAFSTSDWSQPIKISIEELYTLWEEQASSIRKESSRREKVLAKIAAGKKPYIKNENGDRVEEDPNTWEPLPASPKEYVDLRDLPLKKVAFYCAQDTFWTARLVIEVLRKKERQPHEIAWDLNKKAVEALAKVTRLGMPVNDSRVK
ncbi:MAG: hypothetical protein KDH96_08560, partial [Candidatus Riesia sp.]|nr:hypothetical protein [Candidatus Riesia sp.]